METRNKFYLRQRRRREYSFASEASVPGEYLGKPRRPLGGWQACRPNPFVYHECILLLTDQSGKVHEDRGSEFYPGDRNRGIRGVKAPGGVTMPELFSLIKGLNNAFHVLWVPRPLTMVNPGIIITYRELMDYCPPRTHISALRRASVALGLYY